MKNVRVPASESVIIGAGRIRVGEYWDRSIVSLASEAVRLALRDAGDPPADAIYIGNAYATILSRQANLGALVPEAVGHPHLESTTFEAAGASGAAALRAAFLAVESGWIKTAVAVGVEKITDVVGSKAADAANLTLNYEYESSQGLTVESQAALIARRYLETYAHPRDIFRALAQRACENAAMNPYARPRGSLRPDVYDRQAIPLPPLGMFDLAQLGDGAAAVVVTREDCVPPDVSTPPIRILASANATAQISIHDRPQLLTYTAAAQSAERALNQANIRLKKIDAFELDDKTAIDLILSLEAIGLSHLGQGWRADWIPLNHGGGNSGRGYPTGAAGIYQVIEAIDWLRTQEPARTVFVQALGGRAATAISHVLAS